VKYIGVALLFALALRGQAPAQELEPVLERIVIASLATRQGMSLELDRKEMQALAARQAAALLRRLFDEYETMQVRLMTSKSLGGEPKRASGEISWLVRSRGTTITDKTNIFVAFVLENEQWRITEIRFVRP
jgi:hypothetical protein